jgi:hypothetical protein
MDHKAQTVVRHRHCQCKRDRGQGGARRTKAPYFLHLEFVAGGNRHVVLERLRFHGLAYPGPFSLALPNNDYVVAFGQRRPLRRNLATKSL